MPGDPDSRPRTSLWSRALGYLADMTSTNRFLIIASTIAMIVAFIGLAT